MGRAGSNRRSCLGSEFSSIVMRIEKCWFCSSNIYPGHGRMWVRNDCKIFRFCRRKCLAHFKMKHNPRRMRWTKSYRRTVGKEMQMDSTFNFEKKRLTPVRYNRDLMVKTVQAMQIVERIKMIRNQRFQKHRLAANVRPRKTAAQREIAKHEHILTGPTKPKAAQFKEEIAALDKEKENRRKKAREARIVNEAKSSMEVDEEK